MTDDTYPMPKHGWTCFHCGETFTTVGGAGDHFGANPTCTPGCLLKVELGEERGLLMRVRKLEAELERYCEEDTDLHRKIAAMASDHGAALRAEEEKGYERGLRDAGATLKQMRDHGWSVATHNDYRQDGKPMTFWLFTHSRGLWVKGEGETDVEAIDQCLVAVRHQFPLDRELS